MYRLAGQTSENLRPPRSPASPVPTKFDGELPPPRVVSGPRRAGSAKASIEARPGVQSERSRARDFDKQ